jgi:cellulose biosynthesis protein BcsQ
MENRKRPTRGLEEISHLFLSHQRCQDDARNHMEKRFMADDIGNPFLRNDTSKKKKLQEVVPEPLDRGNSCLLFCSSSLYVDRSVLACNLALELARRSFSVGLIETTTKPPTVFFLLESLLLESEKVEKPSSVLEKLLSVPSTILPPEPLKLVSILHGYRGAVRAIFFDKNCDSDGCLTMLNRLSSQSDFLIVNAPADIPQVSEMIAFMNPFIIVPSTADSEELLSSYLLVKKISENTSRSEVGHLIVGESCQARAEAASSIVAEMARKFVSTEVRFMGMIPKGADFSRSILTRTPFLIEAPDSGASRGIRKLADFCLENIIIWGRSRKFGKC